MASEQHPAIKNLFKVGFCPNKPEYLKKMGIPTNISVDEMRDILTEARAGYTWIKSLNLSFWVVDQAKFIRYLEHVYGANPPKIDTENPDWNKLARRTPGMEAIFMDEVGQELDDYADKHGEFNADNFTDMFIIANGVSLLSRE